MLTFLNFLWDETFLKLESNRKRETKRGTKKNKKQGLVCARALNVPREQCECGCARASKK